MDAEFRKAAAKQVLQLRRDMYAMQDRQKAAARKAVKLFKTINKEHAEAYAEEANERACIIDFLEVEIKYINTLVRKEYGAA